MTGRGRISILLIIAQQELRIALRNRWLAAYAIVFAGLTLAISYFGLSIVEYTGFQGFERTTASLLNLVLYLAPLVAMLMAVQSMSAEGGATDQLFAEPVTRGEIVLGKLLGLVGANMLALLFGFGLTGLMIARSVGLKGLASYAVLVGISLLVAVVFSALAMWLAVLAHRSMRAYALVLVAWFVLVLLFDMLVIGLSFLLPERLARQTAFIGLFLNPIDAARVATLLLGSGKETFGVAGALLTRSLGGPVQAAVLLCAALAVWSAVFTGLAVRRMNRQDLS